MNTTNQINVQKKTVLITGASKGIGEALAYEFARNGYRIIAVARDEDKLIELKEKCLKNHGTEVHIIIKDLTDNDASDVLINYLMTHHIKVTSLVNNAGFGVWGNFDATDIEEELALVNLHIVFYLKLTKFVLKDMLQIGTGEILNVASVYSYAAVVGQSVYSASKSFILNHSLALHEELKNKGIKVAVTCPGITLTSFRTKLNRPEKKGVLTMDATTVAKISYSGLQSNKPIIIPGFFNKMFVFYSRVLPHALFNQLLMRINKSRHMNN